MKVPARASCILAAIFSLTAFAYADPTKDKNIGQEVTEKFVTLRMAQDFNGAAALTSNDKKIIAKDAKLIKDDFEAGGRELQKFYTKEHIGTLISRELEPQTLVTSRAGDDGKHFKVRTFFTEHHRVKVRVGATDQIWHYYLHFEYLANVKDGKITGFTFKNVGILMRLRPEDCTKPAICPN